MSLNNSTKSVISSAVMYCSVFVVAGVLLTYREPIFGLVSQHVLPPKTKKSSGHGGLHSVASEFSSPGSQTSVELSASENGHYFTPAEINGRTIDVLIDTGATSVTLPYEDAERAGIYLGFSDFTREGHTANGVARYAPIRLSEVSIGNIRVRDVEALVAERGKLHITLLGMSFLSRLSRADIRDGRLILHE